MQNPIHLSKTTLLYVLAIIGSLIISAWLSSKATINPDGVLYLKAALAYSEGGLDAARSVYKWPFYSISIAVVQQFTHLTFQHAAYLINAFLCVLIVTGFMNLVKILGGNFQVQVFAAIVILVHTGFNDHRDFIIRDFGHWAFLLYGLYFLIVYAQKRSLRYALLFGASMLMAFLFRTEAVFALLLPPLALLLPHDDLSFKQRFFDTLGAYILCYLLAAAAIIGYFLGEPHLAQLPMNNPWLRHLVRMDFMQEMVNQWAALRPAISRHISDGQLRYFMMSGFLGYFLVLLAVQLSPLFIVLSGYGISQKLIKPSVARQLLCAFLVTYTLIVLGFLFYRFFLSGRYVMPIVLLLSLWVPFALSTLYDAWRKRAPGSKYRWVYPTCVVVLVYMFADSMISLKDFGID